MAASQLDTTKQAIAKAENQCAEATLAVQQARSIAEDQASWAINMGLGAHQAVLRQVIDALGEAYSQFEAAHTAASGSKNLLQEVNDQSGREDLFKQAGLAGEKLTEVTSAVAAGKAKVDNEANTNAQASQDENVMNAVNTAMGAATEAYSAVDNAVKAVETYKAQLAQGN